MGLHRNRLSDILAPDTSDPAVGAAGGTELPPGADTSVLSDQDLGAMNAQAAPTGTDFDPTDLEVQQLQAQLDDPNTPPEIRQQIQAQLSLAARRNLAGVGGPPSLPSY